MKDLRETLRRRYLDSIPRKVEALEVDESLLGDEGSEAVQRVRTLCHQLAGSGATYGFDEVSIAARAVEHAPLDQIGGRLEALRSLLSDTFAKNRADRARSLLVIEDDPDMSAVFAEVWAGIGRDIEVVRTAREAEVALQSRPWSLVILDLILPDDDGRSILRSMRDAAATAHTPVIVVTAKAARQTRVECVELGVDHFIEKPADLELLVAAVAAAVKRGETFLAEARTDSLTGLRNRAGFREAVVPQISLSERANLPFSVALLDLDRFKKVNDEHGHAAGDAVLRSVAELLRARLRGSDIPARWGGEEFVVAFPNTTVAGGAVALRKALRAFSALEIKHPGGTLSGMTFSAGVATLAPGAEIDDAIEEADRLLYRAKAAGRNQVLEVVDAASSDAPSVLVAEDDEDTSRMIRALLTADGFAVTSVANGLAALEAAAQHAFSAVLLDWQMPGASGDVVLAKLRGLPLYDRVPIMMLTALGDEVRVARAFDLGADDYVQKPFRGRELLARVRRLLARS